MWETNYSVATLSYRLLWSPSLIIGISLVVIVALIIMGLVLALWTVSKRNGKNLISFFDIFGFSCWYNKLFATLSQQDPFFAVHAVFVFRHQMPRFNVKQRRFFVTFYRA